MRFSLTQLTYFTEAARQGSMTLAARRLHVSQPTLSGAVNQLERDLGVTLFERIPRRGVRLTRRGRQFFDDAVRLLGRAEAMQASMMRSSPNLEGTLRVGMYKPMAAFRAPQMLGEFRRRYPEVPVELTESDQADLVQLLKSGEVDVAVSYSMVPFRDVHTELLEEIPPHLIVPLSHRLARAEGPVSLREVAEDPLVLLDMPHTSGYYLGLYERLGLEPDVLFRLSGYETVRGMVAHGYGVSVLNQKIRLSQTYDGESVRVLPLCDDLPALQVHLVCEVEAVGTPMYEAFAGVCRDQLQGRREALGPRIPAEGLV